VLARARDGGLPAWRRHGKAREGCTTNRAC
jgi:hypothetical protein